MGEVPLRQAFAVAVFGSLLAVGPAGPAAAAAPYKPTEATLELYKLRCGTCHMPDGNSPLEPLNFADGIWKHGDTVKAITEVINEGVQGTAMLPFKSMVTPAEAEALARYVRSFDKKPMKAAPKAGAKKAAEKPSR
jgi:mono/diheme cytochrome c family protein